MDQPSSSSSTATNISPHAALDLHRQLPSPKHGEYDTVVPTTPQGLMLRILKGSGFAAFNGYLRLADGRQSPAELLKCIRGIGDKIVAVDGVFITGMSFDEVIGKIRRASSTKKSVHFRLKEPLSRVPQSKGSERNPIGYSTLSASTVQPETSKGARSKSTQASMGTTPPDFSNLKPKQGAETNPTAKRESLIKMPLQGITPTSRGDGQVEPGIAAALPSAKLAKPNPVVMPTVETTGPASATLVKTSPSGNSAPKQDTLPLTEKSKKTVSVMATASARQAQPSKPLTAKDGLASAVRMPEKNPDLIKPRKTNTSFPTKTGSTMETMSSTTPRPLSVETSTPEPRTGLSAVRDTQTNGAPIATTTTSAIEPALDNRHRKPVPRSSVNELQDAATEDQPVRALNPPMIETVARGSGTTGRDTPVVLAPPKQVIHPSTVHLGTSKTGDSKTAYAWFPIPAPRRQLADRIEERNDFFSDDFPSLDYPSEFPAASAPKSVDCANPGELVSHGKPSSKSLPVSSEADVAKARAESTVADGNARATLAPHNEAVVSPETNENDALFGLTVPKEGVELPRQSSVLTPTKPNYIVGSGVDFPGDSRRVSDGSNSGVPRRRKICASKSVLVDDCTSFSPKRQKLSGNKTDSVFKLVQAKWVDEYDVKKVKRIPIVYAMRMDEFSPQNDDEQYVIAEAAKKARSFATSDAKHKKNLSAKKGGRQRSTTSSVKKSLSVKKVRRPVSVTPSNSNSVSAKKVGRSLSTTPAREKGINASDATNRLKSLDMSAMSNYVKARTPTLIYDGPPNKPLDGGWPDGWVQKTYQRHGSCHADSYYFPPSSSQRLRSIPEVRRFLNR